MREREREREKSRKKKLLKVVFVLQDDFKSEIGHGVRNMNHMNHQ